MHHILFFFFCVCFAVFLCAAACFPFLSLPTAHPGFSPLYRLRLLSLFIIYRRHYLSVLLLCVCPLCVGSTQLVRLEEKNTFFF